MNNGSRVIPVKTSSAAPALELMSRSRPRPLLCLADTLEARIPGQTEFDRLMPAGHIDRFNTRKWWEWEFIAASAVACGVFGPEARAIGLGTGYEPLLFYFARNTALTIGTDLYSADTAWAEARAENLETVAASAPITFPTRNLDLKVADMRALPVEDSSQDFCWSTSSIEHVPSLQDVYEVFAEIHRVLKVGGYAFLTTEFNVGPGHYLLPSLNALDPHLVAALLDSLGGLEIVGARDLSYDWSQPGNAVRARRYLPTSYVSYLGDVELDSQKCGQITNMVGMSAIAPIGFVLRKTTDSLRTWAELPLEPRVRAYSDGIHALYRGDHATAEQHLSTIVAQADLAADPQLGLQSLRFLLDAQIALHGADSEPVRAGVAAAEVLAASSRTADADCLDLVAHLMNLHGRKSEALALTERLALSPSTHHDQVVTLALKALILSDELDDRDRGIAFATRVLGDLLVHGWPSWRLEQMLATSKVAVTLDATLEQSLRQALDAWGIDRLTRMRGSFGDIA